MQIRGPLKFLEVWKGWPWKNHANTLKIESTWFSVGLMLIFLGEKSGVGHEKNCSHKWGPWKFFALKFFFESGPLTSVCEWSHIHQHTTNSINWEPQMFSDCTFQIRVEKHFCLFGDSVYVNLLYKLLKK